MRRNASGYVLLPVAVAIVLIGVVAAATTDGDARTFAIAAALFYLLAPVLEEPWLEHTYGSEYLDYKSRTPRFL